MGDRVLRKKVRKTGRETEGTNIGGHETLAGKRNSLEKS